MRRAKRSATYRGTTSESWPSKFEMVSRAALREWCRCRCGWEGGKKGSGPAAPSLLIPRRSCAAHESGAKLSCWSIDSPTRQSPAPRHAMSERRSSPRAEWGSSIASSTASRAKSARSSASARRRRTTLSTCRRSSASTRSSRRSIIRASFASSTTASTRSGPFYTMELLVGAGHAPARRRCPYRDGVPAPARRRDLARRSCTRGG